jgi:hypothetical protein
MHGRDSSLFRCFPASRRNAVRQQQDPADARQHLNPNLERLRGGGFGGLSENQRCPLTALAQNNCGPDAAAARNGGNFRISSNRGNLNARPMIPGAIRTYRTVCAHLRRCLFPVSFAPCRHASR